MEDPRASFFLAPPSGEREKERIYSELINRRLNHYYIVSASSKPSDGPPSPSTTPKSRPQNKKDKRDSFRTKSKSVENSSHVSAGGSTSASSMALPSLNHAISVDSLSRQKPKDEAHLIKTSGGRDNILRVENTPVLLSSDFKAVLADKELFIRALSDNNLAVVKVLVEATPAAIFDPLAKALMQIFEVNGGAMSLLSWAIRDELAKKVYRRTGLDSSTLFRDNSKAVMLMSQYGHLVGKQYLQDVLGKIVRSVASSKGSFEIQDNALSPKRPNIKRIERLCRAILAAIFGALADIPHQMHTLCHALGMESTQYLRVHEIDVTTTPRSVKRMVIGGFIFLRVFCPAITQPLTFGIISKIHPTAKKGLIYAAKVLQRISNGIPFDPTSNMAELNEFIREELSNMEEYVGRLAKKPMLSPAEMQPMMLSESDEDAALKCLREAMESNEERLTALFT